MERFEEALEHLDARVKITERGYSTQYDKLCEMCRTIDLIEQELGITLEVLFKALKEGIMINNNGILRNLSGIELRYNSYFECWFFEYGMGTAKVKLKDYGKTWWLEKPKDKLENAKA